MADRRFQQFTFSLEKTTVHLYATVNVGAAGAVTLQAWNPTTKAYQAAATNGTTGLHSNGWQGVSAITRVSAGVYNILLQDPYQRVLYGQAVVGNATGLPTTSNFGLWTTGTNVTSNTAPIIKVTMINAAGAAADPASGDQIFFHFILSNSTAT